MHVSKDSEWDYYCQNQLNALFSNKEMAKFISEFTSSMTYIQMCDNFVFVTNPRIY